MYALTEEKRDSNILSMIQRRGVLYNLLFYSLILSVFLLSDIVDFWFFDDIARVIFGVAAIILIPGEFFAVRILGNTRPIGVNFIFGLLLNLIFIQIQFSLAVLFSLRFALDVWLASCNIILLSIIWLLKPNNSEVMSFRYWYNKIFLNLDRSLLKVIIFGLVIRIVLAVLSSNAFSPDGSLYFDYARNINSGLFQTNILNDGAVLNRANNTNELAHQSASYLYAISYMLQSDIGNPILILLISGMLLIVICYEITKQYFGKSSAFYAAVLIAVHPTLVYFSVIGYGPEMYSLVFLLFASFIFLTSKMTNNIFLILPGLFLAFIENIWYVCFYFVVFIFPIIYFLTTNEPKIKSVTIAILLVISLLARNFILNVSIFLILWSLIFSSIYLMNRYSGLKIQKEISLAFSGLFIGMLIVYLPSLISYLFLQASVPSIGLNHLSAALVAIPSLSYIAGVALLVFWHLTPALIVSVFSDSTLWKKDKVYQTILITSILLTFGIAGALSQTESMSIYYLYTSARFILLIISLVSILSAVYISHYVQNKSKTNSEKHTSSNQRNTHTKTLSLVALILFASFLPGYLAFGPSVSFVSPNERYEWNGLVSWVESNIEDSSNFLADRAREFTWLSGKNSVVLGLSQVGLDLLNASNELMALVDEFNVSYILIDGYTITHWRVFDYLLSNNLQIGNAMILDSSKAINQRFNNFTDSIESLKLVYQSLPGYFGGYCRVYQPSNRSFSHYSDVNLTESGWSASNGGSISNSSGETYLTIGPNATYTNTWRYLGPDLNLEINSGYLIFEFEDAGATIARIEIYDNDGGLISYAEQVNNELYYCPLGEEMIGDLRIVIDGSSGDSVIIKSISAWEII